MEYSFTSWERKRHLTPEAERVFPLVAAAGMAGMNRKQLGNAVYLDHETLDQLLASLVGWPGNVACQYIGQGSADFSVNAHAENSLYVFASASSK